MKRLPPLLPGFCCVLLIVSGCSRKPAPEAAGPVAGAPAPVFFQVDPGTAGTITGTIRYAGARPAAKVIDMSGDPACVEAHKGKAYDESLLVSAKGGLGNSFVYVMKGLEGKTFAVPAEAVTIDQRGCWFRPRVLGIQVGQTLSVVNSDPVTHNIHPMAEVNRDWNHSQGPGDAPLRHKFLKPEEMIEVKCNIHSWMRAHIGVVEHPYFAVTKDDGSFTIPNLPPGDYTVAVWHEHVGTVTQAVTVAAKGKAVLNVTMKGK